MLNRIYVIFWIKSRRSRNTDLEKDLIGFRRIESLAFQKVQTWVSKAKM